MAQERSEQLFRHNLAFLAGATAAYAGFASVRGWLFSLVNTNLLQRLRSVRRQAGHAGKVERSQMDPPFLQCTLLPPAQQCAA